MSMKTTQLNIGGRVIDGETARAKNFNNFFSNVGPNTENTIPKVPNISPLKFLKDRIQLNFIIAHTSNEEILGIINALEHKSTGPSSIPLKLLSLLPDLIIMPLAYIINMSFSTGVFPKLMKIVKVIPIHKGGVFSKLMKIVKVIPIHKGGVFSKLMKIVKVIPIHKGGVFSKLMKIVKVIPIHKGGVFSKLMKIVKVIPIHKGGVFSKLMKIVKVIPIHKGGVFSKLMKIVKVIPIHKGGVFSKLMKIVKVIPIHKGGVFSKLMKIVKVIPIHKGGVFPKLMKIVKVIPIHKGGVFPKLMKIVKVIPIHKGGVFSKLMKIVKVIPIHKGGVFSKLMKIVKVIPIHKGGSTQDVNNYRPISLLSIFDKIIEKIMHKQLYAFLEYHNILFQNQFGFRRNNSTVYALAQITEIIKESIGKGKYGCGIFKDFDTVNHGILLKKLEHYGIRDNMLDWFQSYLSYRKQYVDINGKSSDLLDITCGVPQGSVLGPLLFLIYINDLPNISKILNFYLFADDTNIYYESSSLDKLERTVNRELNKLFLWLNVNRLSLNIDKTNFIVFHPYNKPIKKRITININNNAIKEKEYIKHLGVLIDSAWYIPILSMQ